MSHEPNSLLAATIDTNHDQGGEREGVMNVTRGDDASAVDPGGVALSRCTHRPTS